MQTGLVSLVHDNWTESGNTINVVHRFNIFQEIVLAVLYRLTPFQVTGTFLNDTNKYEAIIYCAGS